MKPTVKILSGYYDLYDLGYVKSISNIRENKSFSQTVLMDNKISIECHNYDNFFSWLNGVTILGGTQWKYATLVITNTNGLTVWDGIIDDIELNYDNQTAKIISTSIFKKYADIIIEYESTDFETPATAMRNILDTYSMPYDNRSITLTEESVSDLKIKCNINKSDGTTLSDAIEMLAQYSCAYPFLFRNVLYFKFWNESVKTAKSTFTSFVKNPRIKSLNDDLINDYNVYVGGIPTPVTDAGSNNIGAKSRAINGTRELPSSGIGEGEQVWLQNNGAAAVFLGEQWIKRTNYDYAGTPRPRIQVSFSVLTRDTAYLDLSSYVRLTFAPIGFNNKLFEVFEFEFSEQDKVVNIVAIEADE